MLLFINKMGFGSLQQISLISEGFYWIIITNKFYYLDFPKVWLGTKPIGGGFLPCPYGSYGPYWLSTQCLPHQIFVYGAFHGHSHGVIGVGKSWAIYVRVCWWFSGLLHLINITKCEAKLVIIPQVSIEK